MSEIFHEYPFSFPAHSDPAARQFRMRRDCFACPDDKEELARLPVLAHLPGEGVKVVAGRLDEMDRSHWADCRPVYAFSDHELPAIPTGRVFVQRAPEIDLAAILKPLNYQVESVPEYAPTAAWIVASDGSIASALSGLGRLLAADGIEAVEPQMLRPASPRDMR